MAWPSLWLYIRLSFTLPIDYVFMFIIYLFISYIHVPSPSFSWSRSLHQCLDQIQSSGNTVIELGTKFMRLQAQVHCCCCRESNVPWMLESRLLDCQTNDPPLRQSRLRLSGKSISNPQATPPLPPESTSHTLILPVISRFP